VEGPGNPRCSEQNNQQTGQPVQAPSVNSSSLDDMFKVATIVQQITTELNRAVSEEDKRAVIIKITLNVIKKMVTRAHRPLKSIAFNANGIGRQDYDISKQLQEQCRDVALLSGTHLKPHERFYILNYQV
jgi:hypothetical protein